MTSNNLIFFKFTVFLSTLNFLPFLYISEIPLFHFLLSTNLVLFILSNKFLIKKLNLTIYGPLFLLSSFPAFVLGLSYGVGFSYLYFLLSVLLVSCLLKINLETFDSLLSVLLFSCLFIVSIGWGIRFGIIDLTFASGTAKESEYLLGYWGIRYSESTRNADYIYPLVGLCISLYFLLKVKENLMLLFFSLFLVSLIASLSRAALIIALLYLCIIFIFMNRKNRLFIIFLLVIMIGYNFELFYKLYDSVYFEILNSILTTKSTDTRFSNAGRLLILYDAIYAAIHNPIGYGVDNYNLIYKTFDFGPRLSNSSENAFITILVERGWIPFIAFLAIFYFNFKKAISYYLTYKIISFNFIFLPALFIYFAFNYELNSIFPNFLFMFVFIETYLNSKRLNLER